MANNRQFHDMVSLRRMLDERLHKLEDSLRRQSGDVYSQVEQRKSLARSLDLPNRLLDMYTQIHDSADWQPAPSPPDPDVDDTVDGTEQDPAIQKSFLFFDHNNHRYALRVTRRPGDHLDSPVGPRHQPQTLLSFCGPKGLTLLTINIFEDLTPDGPQFHSTDIKAFLPGNWIKDFLELSEQVTALKKEMMIRKKYEAAELDKLKHRFGL